MSIENGIVKARTPAEYYVNEKSQQGLSITQVAR